MKTVSLFLFLILAVLLCQCVTPINPDIRSLPPSLVVDGLVTDQPGRNRIFLSLTAEYSPTSLNLLVSNATVFVTSNTNQRVNFREISPGYFQPENSNWQGEAGKSYTLNVRLSDGREYRSQPELLRPVVPIDTIYTEFTQNLIPGTTTYNKGFDVYIDVKDPATTGDYYRWSWVHYEMPRYCGFEYQTFGGEPPRVVEFGLLCCGNCWEITRLQNQINIASDQAINGNRISRRPILRAPFTSYSPYYVEVEQQSLTKEAYLYLSTLNDLVNNTGGLFDAAPATLLGNMSNTSNPDELVFGFFGASAIQVKPLQLDRSKAPTMPDLYPYPPPIPYPPGTCASCIEGPTRTAKAPKWWVF